MPVHWFCITSNISLSVCVRLFWMLLSLLRWLSKVWFSRRLESIRTCKQIALPTTTTDLWISFSPDLSSRSPWFPSETMMANGQHEDLIKFVSEAWTRVSGNWRVENGSENSMENWFSHFPQIVENSRGEAPIFYKFVPEQTPTTQRNNSYNSNASTTGLPGNQNNHNNMNSSAPNAVPQGQNPYNKTTTSSASAPFRPPQQ